MDSPTGQEARNHIMELGKALNLGIMTQEHGWWLSVFANCMYKRAVTLFRVRLFPMPYTTRDRLVRTKQDSEPRTAVMMTTSEER